MKRLAAIDFGLARIGIAVSDVTRTIASPLNVLHRDKDDAKTIKAISAELEKYQPIEKIVFGLPLHLDGTESDMSRNVRAFAEKLSEALSIPVTFWDERLTTLQVERTLKESGLSRKKRKKHVDPLAAALILQSFLDNLTF